MRFGVSPTLTGSRVSWKFAGHAHAIYRFGLTDLLPPNIELIHRPGCPACLQPMGRIDDGLSIASAPSVNQVNGGCYIS
jgi:hydrogenase expression/formation protein HypD